MVCGLLAFLVLQAPQDLRAHKAFKAIQALRALLQLLLLEQLQLALPP
jgi:hypothetical protein